MIGKVSVPDYNNRERALCLPTDVEAPHAHNAFSSRSAHLSFAAVEMCWLSVRRWFVWDLSDAVLAVARLCVHAVALVHRTYRRAVTHSPSARGMSLFPTVAPG